jgi:nucleoside-diphosphate-sugar epimerase
MVSMSRSSVLITGAGGFVGGWITEALYLADKYDVRAGVGRWASCARIARFPVEIAHCDIRKADSLDAAMQGVDTIVHCAYSKSDLTTVVEGTRLVLERAAANGVKRIIHVSSVATYGSADGVVAEDTPSVKPINPYGQSKRDSEDLCRAAATSSLKVVVVRPSLIYGPFSDLWTIPYIGRIMTGRWTKLGSAGEGKANLIYIADLVRFVDHLISANLPNMSLFNANGPEVVTFNDYFERLSVALGCGSLPAPNESLGLQVALRRPVRLLGRYLLKNHQALLLKAASKSFVLKDAMKRAEADLRLKPNDDELVLYRTNVSYSTRLAESIGFKSRVSLDEGIATSVQWARHIGLV